MSYDELELRRRHFLKVAGGSAFMSLVAGTGMGALSTEAWSAPLKSLTDHEGRTLLMMARTLFPHDFLADSYYMNVVSSIDGKASGDAATRSAVADGVKKLDAAYKGGFKNASEKARVRVLKTMEGSSFFSMVYGETLNGLYGNPDIWKIFGYEGSSVEHGGYIERGFDDIAWLPKD